MEYTIEPNKSQGVNVYHWSIYPESSVLAGQNCKKFVDSYDTPEEAAAAYPGAAEGYRDACNTYNHLPDENGYTYN